MKKLMVMIAIVAMALLVAHSVYAVGTTAGTIVTNRASVNGANFTTVNIQQTTNIRLIVGGGWSAQADVTSVVAGTTYSNVTYITNLGNSMLEFMPTVTVVTATGGAGTLAGFWPWSVTTNLGVAYFNGTGTLAAGNGITLNAGQSKRLVIKVAVPASMSSSGYEQYTLSATVPTSHVNTLTYTGDNGTLYGGSTTSGWGRVTVDQLTIYGTGVGDGSTQQAWRLTGGGAPLISIVKTITGIGIVDASGVDGVAVPGATISYQIKVSNAIGAGIANSVVVRDTVDTVNLVMGIAGFSGGASENQWDMRTNGSVITWSNISAAGAIEAGNVGFLTMTAIIR